MSGQVAVSVSIRQSCRTRIFVAALLHPWACAARCVFPSPKRMFAKEARKEGRKEGGGGVWCIRSRFAFVWTYAEVSLKERPGWWREDCERQCVLSTCRGEGVGWGKLSLVVCVETRRGCSGWAGGRVCVRPTVVCVFLFVCFCLFLLILVCVCLCLLADCGGLNEGRVCVCVSRGGWG